MSLHYGDDPTPSDTPPAYDPSDPASVNPATGMPNYMDTSWVPGQAYQPWTPPDPGTVPAVPDPPPAGTPGDTPTDPGGTTYGPTYDPTETPPPKSDPLQTFANFMKTAGDSTTTILDTLTKTGATLGTVVNVGGQLYKMGKNGWEQVQGLAGGAGGGPSALAAAKLAGKGRFAPANLSKIAATLPKSRAGGAGLAVAAGLAAWWYFK